MEVYFILYLSKMYFKLNVNQRNGVKSPPSHLHGAVQTMQPKRYEPNHGKHQGKASCEPEGVVVDLGLNRKPAKNDQHPQGKQHLNQLRRCLDTIRHLQRISNGKRAPDQHEREQILQQLEVSF